MTQPKLITNNAKLTPNLNQFSSLFHNIEEGEKVDAPNDGSMAFAIEFSSLGRSFQ